MFQKTNRTEDSSAYSNSAIERMVRNISVDYYYLRNTTVLDKIRMSFSKKEILALLLKQFKLYNFFESGKIEIRYNKKDSSTKAAARVSIYQLDGRISKYEIMIFKSNADDELKSVSEKNKFISSMAHELSHIRFYEDSYKYAHFELAVDILFMTAGHLDSVYFFFKESPLQSVGYVNYQNAKRIFSMIEDRSQIIYLWKIWLIVSQIVFFYQLSLKKHTRKLVVLTFFLNEEYEFRKTNTVYKNSARQ